MRRALFASANDEGELEMKAGGLYGGLETTRFGYATYTNRTQLNNFEKLAESPISLVML